MRTPVVFWAMESTASAISLNMAATRRQTKSKRFLVVGLVCLDIVNVVDRYPGEDEDVRAISQRWQKGGNAANMAVVLSQTLCVQTELLCSLDQGILGEFAKKEITKRGVSMENSPIKADTGFPTSCVILNRKSGTRTILHSRNDLPELSFEDFDKLDLSLYKWIHFEGRHNVTEIIRMIQKVQWFNSTTESQLIVSVELEKKREDLKKLLPLADVIFLSKDFAQYCGFTSAKEAVLNLRKEVKRKATLICCWGDQGACVSAMGHGESLNFVSSCAFPPNQIIDTLGAGDTFCAAVIHYLEQNKPFEEAIVFGCKLAGRKCGIHGFDGLRFDGLD